MNVLIPITAIFLSLVEFSIATPQNGFISSSGTNFVSTGSYGHGGSYGPSDTLGNSGNNGRKNKYYVPIVSIGSKDTRALDGKYVPVIAHGTKDTDLSKARFYVPTIGMGTTAVAAVPAAAVAAVAILGLLGTMAATATRPTQNLTMLKTP
ncbi:unnamed protein product [Strongylus vulgaris]|uniref:Uncharacterized protein n=1 Tax=Strongylus vulgaris TaxID=40348 RepID=A0A3P7I0F6_STRVU|nr:unnamed protein product [Strongylus vulgaris]